jgi:hypothetical protein
MNKCPHCGVVVYANPKVRKACGHKTTCPDYKKWSLVENARAAIERANGAGLSDSNSLKEEIVTILVGAREIRDRLEGALSLCNTAPKESMMAEMLDILNEGFSRFSPDWLEEA